MGAAILKIARIRLRSVIGRCIDTVLSELSEDGASAMASKLSRGKLAARVDSAAL